MLLCCCAAAGGDDRHSARLYRFFFSSSSLLSSYPLCLYTSLRVISVLMIETFGAGDKHRNDDLRPRVRLTQVYFNLNQWMFGLLNQIV